MFGESEFVSMSEARKVIERALAKCPRVVGHDVGGDLRWVRKHLNVKTDHCVIYDTIRMHKIIERTKQARKLCKCCDDYGLFHEAPHNAGNDSHVNMYLFVGMSKKIRNLRTTEIRKAA
jgi:DNA polymerase III alpha subunit (gram-positive type)